MLALTPDTLTINNAILPSSSSTVFLCFVCKHLTTARAFAGGGTAHAQSNADPPHTIAKSGGDEGSVTIKAIVIVQASNSLAPELLRGGGVYAKGSKLTCA